MPPLAVPAIEEAETLVVAEREIRVLGWVLAGLGAEG